MPNQRFPCPGSGVFSVFRGGLERGRDWLRARPLLAPWFNPAAEESAESRYRKFNGWYFAQFFEQERMLADKPRMNFYHTAIQRQVQPGDRVIDLGTGTGILAAFAARRGAAKVYAIDHSEILEHAKALAIYNGVENVEFVSTHSSDFTLDQPVDVIVHEQMGDWLFDEGMVANVCDLRDRILKPGGTILPNLFELYCEPVKLKDERQVPFIWELDVHGFDYSCLERNRPQEPGYYRLGSCDPGLIDHFLGEPAPVLSFDLHSLCEAELPKEVSFARTVVQAGRCDGYAVYFRARTDGGLCLSSGPLDPGRACHWGFRILRCDREDFEAGDVIEVKLMADQWVEPDSWRWSHPKRSADRSRLERGATPSRV